MVTLYLANIAYVTGQEIRKYRKKNSLVKRKLRRAKGLFLPVA